MKMDKADGKRVVALGGSHGGFLSVHVVAQFPVSSNWHTGFFHFVFLTIGFLSSCFCA